MSEEQEIRYLEVNYFHPVLNSLYVDAFMYLESLDTPVVPIVINSYGGAVSCLGSLLDCIQGSTKPVMTISTGNAMSCGADLFVSATKGMRIVGPNTTSLIHQVSSFSWGKVSDMKTEFEHANMLNDEMLYKLFDKAGNHEAGYTENLITQAKNADIYLTAEEMIQHGWADKIMPMNEALRNIGIIYEEWANAKNEPIINKISLDEIK